MHHRSEDGGRRNPPKPGRKEPLAAPLVDRPGGRRHRATEDGERTPRDPPHRGERARPLRLYPDRLLPLAGLYDGEYPYGRRHGADSRTVRIPRARRALEAAQHHPHRQERTEPGARNRRLRADYVHAQPPQQPGGERSSQPLRRAGLRHNNSTQYPFRRSPLARKTRHLVRCFRRRVG